MHVLAFETLLTCIRKKSRSCGRAKKTHGRAKSLDSMDEHKRQNSIAEQRRPDSTAGRRTQDSTDDHRSMNATAERLNGWEDISDENLAEDMNEISLRMSFNFALIWNFQLCQRVLNIFNIYESNNNDSSNFVNEDCTPWPKIQTTAQQNPMRPDLTCTSPNHELSHQIMNNILHQYAEYLTMLRWR